LILTELIDIPFYCWTNSYFSPFNKRLYVICFSLLRTLGMPFGLLSGSFYSFSYGVLVRSWTTILYFLKHNLVRHDNMSVCFLVCSGESYGAILLYIRKLCWPTPSFLVSVPVFLDTECVWFLLPSELSVFQLKFAFSFLFIVCYTISDWN